MKHNARRVLGIVLALLLCLGMCTGIVLPAAAVETEAPADPYAKVTGTEENGVITPDAGIYFVDSRFGKAPYTGTFEYTYGDGITWGNGKTYRLTYGSNAFETHAKGTYRDIFIRQSQDWVAGNAPRDIVLAFAPGEYSGWVYITLNAKSDDPTLDQLANFHILGAQAGKSPISTDKSTKAKAKETTRSVDSTKETVFNTMLATVSFSNMYIDGVSGNKAFFLFGRADVGKYCNLNLKNFYMDEMTTGWADYYNSFFVFQPACVNVMVQFDSCYFNLNDRMAKKTKEYNEIYANKIVFDNCVFADGKLSEDNTNNITHQINLNPVAATKVSSNFYGTYAANPLIEFKNSVVADWESARFFNFYPAGAEMSSYTNNAIKINIENNKFLDVNTKDTNSPYPRMISIEKIETQAQANSFEFNLTNNYFNQSDELFGNAGFVHSFISTNATANTIKVKSKIKENVFQLPNRTATLSFWETSSSLHDGPLFDLSGNLFMDNKGNIMPVRGWWSVNNVNDSYWKVQSDLYASDEMKGGIKELMTVKNVENGVASFSDIQLVDRASFTINETYLLGRVTLILKDGVEYDADKLFSYADENVDFLGVYAEEACTTKLETVTKNNVHGKFAKAQYKTENTTLTVVYMLYVPHTYLIVDPTGEYATNGYTFNGIKYEDGKTADDGISSKFYTSISDAYGKDGANMPPFHLNAFDSLKTSNVNYTVTGIGTRSIPYNYAGVGTVILLTPGEHVIGSSASGAGNLALRKNVSIVGPQWAVSPYGEGNDEGKLANGRSTNAATEAVIKGYFTPAADSGWINTVIDGVVFMGSGYAINPSHLDTKYNSLYQAEVIKNCVFATSGATMIGPATDVKAKKILDMTIRDCAFDTITKDRRKIETSFINITASVADIGNIAVLTKYCLEDEDTAFATLSSTSENLGGWTPRDDAQIIGDVTFYAANHNYIEENEIAGTKIPATCMANGSVNFICVCGETATEILPKNAESHTGNNTEGVGAKEATCGEKGYTGDVVCECGAVITKGEDIPATGEHNYIIEVEGTKVAATCKATGTVTMKCDKCDATQEKTLAIDASNHTGVNTEGVNAKEATCGEKGYTGDVVCECGAVITKGEDIPATGAHTEGEQVTVTEPTVSTDGLATVSCSKCGALIREIVLPKTGVASIGDEKFATFAEAIAAAKAGDTIQLYADVEVEFLALDPAVKLDLNGKQLKADYFIGFKGSAVYGGKLIAPQDKVALDQTNGGYLPVFDGEGYIFITVGLKEAKAVDAESGETYYYFSPDLSAAHEELFAGAEASGVKVVVRLSWTKEGNYTAEQSFIYMDKFVQEVIESYGEKVEYPDYYTKMFTASFAGSEADTAEDLMISAVLVSDTGVEIASTGVSFAK